MRKLNHFGIPTATPVSGELYNSELKLWYIQVDASPNRYRIPSF